MFWRHRAQPDDDLERACRVGFLVVGTSSTAALKRFETWCRQHGRPLVWIRSSGRRADVALRMDTCRGSLAEEERDEWSFRLDLMTPHGGVLADGLSYLITDVPLGQAEMVAFRLFEWASDGLPVEV